MLLVQCRVARWHRKELTIEINLSQLGTKLQSSQILNQVFESVIYPGAWCV